MTKKENNNNLFFICTLFLTLSLPLLDNIFGFSDRLELKIDENRVFAKLPSIKKESGRISGSLIKKFPKKFERFYNDHFGFREPIIYLADRIGLKDQSSKKYIIGQDGWLFLNQESSIKNIVGSNTLSSRKLEETSKILISNWQKCKKIGIDYIFVIAPSKYSIYPEYLPESLSRIRMQRKNHLNNTDQVIQNVLKLQPNFPILDLRKKILKEKSKTDRNIYYETDTHWNGLGISIAYKELLKELSHKYNLSPAIAKYKITEQEIDYGDLTKMSGIKHKYLSSIIDVKIDFKSNGSLMVDKDRTVTLYKNYLIGNKKEKILIHHDSFFDGQMKELIANSFYETLFFHKYGDCAINDNLLKIKNLSLVVQEMVERKFVMCERK